MTEKKITIKTEFIKLDSLLKFAGEAGTGGEAKNAILNGEVTVGGEICLQRGRKLYKGDRVQIGGTVIEVA